MPLLADRVKETTATTGTGTLTVLGAAAGFRSFVAAFGSAASVYYTIAGGADFEIGEGTTGAGTLSRDTVLVSSNGGALVDFAAGVKDVFCSYTGARAVTTTDAAVLTNKSMSGGQITSAVAAASLAAAATVLATPRTIGGTSFDGSANIAVALAASSTVLATPRAINGVDFNGSAPITVTAAAGTLTGTEMAATVVTSSLTSVGTLAALTVTAAIVASAGVEVGHPSDTSITRVRAGVIAVEGVNVGYLEVPQNAQSAAYTTVLADTGKHLLHPSADTTARTFTIAANASVAYPIGTAITFVNQNGAGVLTIAITTDVMRLAGAGTTGSRTLAANGIATALKLTATEWLISGTGLT